ncbi:hypothetical protein VQ643_00655 [Pseudomonas sp. F1_0610]|uniref:hypothetical protein n=1 Tax=Pseudomonas sp. F1_0610 TaxID=3114284 RepID=UPI0039C4BBD0
MGTIKTGFWNCKFIITPEEFAQFIEKAVEYKIKFHLPDYQSTQLTAEQLLEKYIQFYQELTALEQPELHRGFVCSLIVEYSGGTSGFHLVNTDVRLFSGRSYLDRALSYLNITFPKGKAVDTEDGKYFYYEDILLTESDVYAIYEKLTDFVKSRTKPLRFEALVIDEIKQVKPAAVRISQQAARDIEHSWYFKKMQLTMRSFK